MNENNENSNINNNDEEIDYYKHFERKTGIGVLAGMPQREGWWRKGVIVNYPSEAGPALVNNFKNYVDWGFTIVMTTDSIKDDRLFSPNAGARVSIKPAPLTGRTSEGYEYVVMEIEQDKFNKKLIERQEETHNKYLQSLRRVSVDTKNNVHMKDFDSKI